MVAGKRSSTKISPPQHVSRRWQSRKFSGCTNEYRPRGAVQSTREWKQQGQCKYHECFFREPRTYAPHRAQLERFSSISLALPSMTSTSPQSHRMCHAADSSLRPMGSSSDVTGTIPSTRDRHVSTRDDQRLFVVLGFIGSPVEYRAPIRVTAI